MVTQVGLGVRHGCGLAPTKHALFDTMLSALQVEKRGRDDIVAHVLINLPYDTALIEFNSHFLDGQL